MGATPTRVEDANCRSFFDLDKNCRSNGRSATNEYNYQTVNERGEHKQDHRINQERGQADKKLSMDATKATPYNEPPANGAREDNTTAPPRDYVTQTWCERRGAAMAQKASAETRFMFSASGPAADKVAQKYKGASYLTEDSKKSSSNRHRSPDWSKEMKPSGNKNFIPRRSSEKSLERLRSNSDRHQLFERSFSAIKTTEHFDDSSFPEPCAPLPRPAPGSLRCLSGISSKQQQQQQQVQQRRARGSSPKEKMFHFK